MTRALLLAAALAMSACGAVVAPSNDAVALPADTAGILPPDTVVAPPDTVSPPDVADADAALADRLDDFHAPDGSLDAAELGCVPVGPPGATAIVTDADMAFPDGALTLEEWVDWDERMRNLDLIRCPTDSIWDLTTSRVTPDPTDD